MAILTSKMIKYFLMCNARLFPALQFWNAIIKKSDPVCAGSLFDL